MVESVQEIEGHQSGEWEVLKRRTLLGFMAMAIAGFAGKAQALPYRAIDWGSLKARAYFRQTGPVYERLLKVTNRVWSTLGQPRETLEVGVIETDGVRAEVLTGGKVWVTSSFLVACQSDAELAAWFCQRILAVLRTDSGEVLDRSALETHLASGYDPRAVLTLWSRWATTEKLRNSSRFKDIPLTSGRLGALRTQIEKLGYFF